MRVEAIKGSLVGKELADGFRQLYEETFNVEHFKLTATYLSIASNTLGNSSYGNLREVIPRTRY